MTPIKILLADDHEMIRGGMKLLLENEPDFVICGEASDGRAAVIMAESLQPDVVVLDILMPEMNGVDATRRIKQVAPKSEVLIFSSQETESLVHEVLQAGATGYLLKTGASRHIIPAIRALAAHQPFFSSKISQIVFEGYLANARGAAGTANSPLTPREREIVQLVAEGKSNKEVAAALGISVKTAETHRAAVIRKLELDSISDLVRYAIRNHIIEA